jgi:hypothetical protein
MTYTIEILVPVGNDAQLVLSDVRDKLTTTFGGVTMHVNAPAEGLWEIDGDIDRDRIVVVEVMTDDLDREWWATYRKELEDRLDQQEIIIKASRIQRL